MNLSTDFGQTRFLNNGAKNIIIKNIKLSAMNNATLKISSMVVTGNAITTTTQYAIKFTNFSIIFLFKLCFTPKTYSALLDTT